MIAYPRLRLSYLKKVTKKGQGLVPPATTRRALFYHPLATWLPARPVLPSGRLALRARFCIQWKTPT